MTAIQNNLSLQLAASINGIDRRDVDTWARLIAGRPLPNGLLDLTDDEARRVAEQIARAAGILPPRNADRPTSFPDVGYPPDHYTTEDDAC